MGLCRGRFLCRDHSSGAIAPREGNTASGEKLLSGIFDVSINTLLGTPRRLVCQCCGMPLEDGVIGREPDGSFNEDYCKWCYADGVFAYQSKEQLLDFLLAHMPNPENTPAAERRTQYDAYLSQLKHWK